METVITGVYGDGSVIDNDAAGCMESVLFCLNCKNTTGNIDISKLCVIRILRFDRTVCSINVKASIQNFKLIFGCEGYLVDDLKEIVVNSNGASLDASYVVFDIETTGFHPSKNKIIEKW